MFVNVCIFDLRSLIIAKYVNGNCEIAGRWQNNSSCQANMSPECCM